MAKLSSVKSVLTGIAVIIVLSLLLSALCAVFALKSGSAVSLYTICAAVSVGIASAVGSFISSKLGTRPVLALCSGLTAALLLLVMTLIQGNSGWYMSPSACAAGSLLAFAFASKKGTKHRKPRIKKKR